MPTTRMATISKVVATGRRTKMRDGFMWWSARLQPTSRRSTAGRSAAAWRTAARRPIEATLAIAPASAVGKLRLLVLVFGLRDRTRLGYFSGSGIRQLHLGALAQAVAAVGHDHIIHIDAGLDGLGLPIDYAQHDRAHRDRIV